MEEKAHIINVLKQAQEELKEKSAEEITKLKKEQDLLVVEKAHLFDSQVKLKEEVADSYQHVLESTGEMDVMARAQWTGAFISHL